MSNQTEFNKEDKEYKIVSDGIKDSFYKIMMEHLRRHRLSNYITDGIKQTIVQVFDEFNIKIMLSDYIKEGIKNGFYKVVKEIHYNTLEYLIKDGIKQSFVIILNNLSLSNLIKECINTWLDKNKDEIINQIKTYNIDLINENIILSLLSNYEKLLTKDNGAKILNENRNKIRQTFNILLDEKYNGKYDDIIYVIENLIDNILND